MMLRVPFLLILAVVGAEAAAPAVRRAPLTHRACLRMGQVSEPAKEGPGEAPTPLGGPASPDLDDELSASPFEPGSKEELEDMRRRVAQYQAELDAERQTREYQEKQLDEEGGFLGDSLPGFISSSLKSIPLYEVPNPGAMVQKMGLSVAGLVTAFVLVTLIDGALIEGLRPIVKYQVDSTPML